MTNTYNIDRVNDFVEKVNKTDYLDLLDFINHLHKNPSQHVSKEAYDLMTGFDELSSWEKGNSLKKLETRWMDILRKQFTENWRQARLKE